MAQHSLDEKIKQLDKDLDTYHLRLSNNHGDFIHEFVFSKYLGWLQTLINDKLAVHFGFIQENRKAINEIDAEFHQLRSEFDALKADYEQQLVIYKNEIKENRRNISALETRVNALENK